MEATVIFPHQLFDLHPGLSKDREVFLVEDQLFFSDFRYKMQFHKKKIIFHRSSMLAFRDRLISKDYKVFYIDFQKDSKISRPFERLKTRKIKKIYLADVVDHRLEQRITTEASRLNIELIWLPTPCFLTQREWFEDFFRDTKHYSQTKFYIAQRKKLKILLKNEIPLGGKWTFDPLNRKSIPKNMPIPKIRKPKSNTYTIEALNYTERLFPSNPGISEGFFYPITQEDAKEWLKDFLTQRLRFFGDYQDAMEQDQAFLFHSVLTPMLNTGLLTPREVIDRTLDYAEENPIPLNALEGFIRQIIGWREFMRIIYAMEAGRERTTNFWQHKRGLPSSFYNGTTGITPVDTVIRRLLKYSYCHHIERLMILGNFMLLCEIDPDEIYRWFMEMFIDAYDWVMVPNVYGMSQYADGGLITTKPYISSSKYIQKMSDFPKGKWCNIWDGLYWRFIHKHQGFFLKNPRMKVMTFQLNKMGKEKLNQHLRAAEEFLSNFY
jgi:deoxyribodipyrimidine photolyase-related protein